MSHAIIAALAIGLALTFRAQAADYPAAAAQAPMLFVYVLVVLALLMAAEALLRRRAAGTLEASPPLRGRRLRLMAGFSAAILGYVLALDYAGYLVATAAFLLGSFLACRALPPIRAAVVAVGVMAVVYVIFIYFLRLPMPLTPSW